MEAASNITEFLMSIDFVVLLSFWDALAGIMPQQRIRSIISFSVAEIVPRIANGQRIDHLFLWTGGAAVSAAAVEGKSQSICTTP
jgi:hypothetical protein